MDNITRIGNDQTICSCYYLSYCSFYGDTKTAFSRKGPFQLEGLHLEIHTSDFVEQSIAKVIIVYCTKQYLTFLKLFTDIFSLPFKVHLSQSTHEKLLVELFFEITAGRKNFLKFETPYFYHSSLLSNESFTQYLLLMAV